MDYLKDFIKPELLILIPVLYIIGAGIKASRIDNAKIPVIIGTIAIILSTLYIVSTCAMYDYKEVIGGIFTAVTQGILVAGCSVYIHQLIKQSKNSCSEKRPQD